MLLAIASDKINEQKSFIPIHFRGQLIERTFTKTSPLKSNRNKAKIKDTSDPTLPRFPYFHFSTQTYFLNNYNIPVKLGHFHDNTMKKRL